MEKDNEMTIIYSNCCCVSFQQTMIEVNITFFLNDYHELITVSANVYADILFILLIE